MSDPEADAGHVFVMKGDVQRLACDVYLQSTDRDLNPHGTWVKAIPDAPRRRPTPTSCASASSTTSA